MRYISRQTDLEVDNEADGGVDEGIKVLESRPKDALVKLVKTVETVETVLYRQ